MTIADRIAALKGFCTRVACFLYLMVYRTLYHLTPWLIRRPKSVKGEKVLITGAAQGFGRLLAERFAAQGADLILWDIDMDKLEQTATSCRDYGVQVDTYSVDVSNRDQITHTAEKIKYIDILVNNAGVAPGKFFSELTNEQMERTIKINTMAHIYTVKAFLPYMVEKEKGHIVCIASMAAFAGAATLVDYTASKFGAFGFMEALECEMMYLGKNFLNFTTICPSFMDTRMVDQIEAIKIKGKKGIADPAVVADSAMIGILNNENMVIYPFEGYFLYFAKGLLPSIVYKQIVLTRLLRKNDKLAQDGLIKLNF